MLCCSIKYDEQMQRCVAEKEKLDTRDLFLEVQRIPFQNIANRRFLYSADGNAICAAIGYFSNLGDIKKRYDINATDDVDVVAAIFNKYGYEALLSLEGVFSVFIWDCKKGEGYIFQDRYGSNLPIYYCYDNNHFMFSTSLKYILRHMALKRELNYSAVNEFLHTMRVVPNENTLIKNIYKVLPNQAIAISKRQRGIEFHKIANPISKVSESGAKSALVLSIQNELDKLLDMVGQEIVGTALSSGYDTNLILHFLAKRIDKIIAATIGGKHVNEIYGASICARQYANVTHKSVIIDSEKLESLPDIVWRTDGYLFERGLFLSSEFASLLSHDNIRYAFLGDGGDQQLQPYKNFILEKIKRECIQNIKGSLLGKIIYTCIKKEKNISKYKQNSLSKSFPAAFSRVKFDVIIDYILKKNGILLNSYDIQPLYPFMNKETRNLSYSLGKAAKNKGFYKREVIKIVGDIVGSTISKIGGSTDIEYLLDGKQDIVAHCLDKQIIRKILSDRKRKDVLQNPQFYCETILQLICIYLFNELFVSGKYDSQFQQSGFPAPLTDIISNE